jgi:zinc transporter
LTTPHDKESAAAPCDEDGASETCPGIICAFGVSNSTGFALDADDLKSGGRLEQFDWVWVHLNLNSDEAVPWVRAQSYLPGAAVDALTAGETRPRATRIDNGIAVNLRGVNHNPGAEPEDMVALRIWVDEKHVVTARRRAITAIEDVRDVIEKPNSGPATPGELVALLASKITHNIEPYVEEVTDAIDELEDFVLEERGINVRARLAEARRIAVHLRRYIAPQRDAINSLSLSDIDLFSQRTRISLRETSDAVTRMTEEIDAARERAMILHEQIMDQRSEEMNRNMLILATATAVFLPLQFIVGLLGINVAGIPGAQSPFAFWIVLAVSLTIGAALIGFFKARGWI